MVVTVQDSRFRVELVGWIKRSESTESSEWLRVSSQLLRKLCNVKE